VSSSMRAAVYHGRHDIRIEERPVPRPAAGELLLRVGAVGVCGSDVGEWAHGPIQHPVNEPHPATGHRGPVIPGHEFSGTVVDVGEGVDPAWLGRAVASCGASACGACDACRDGASNRCARYSGVGLHRDGALAEYVATPVASCVAVDDLGLSLDEAALCQPMAIALHCVSRAGDVAGRTVVVVGVGGIGAFLVIALVESGAHVLAVDVDEARLALAGELGAHRRLHVAGDRADAERVLAALDGERAPVVMEVSGTAGGLATALAVAPTGGRIVAVGIQGAPRSLDLARLTVREQSIIGTNALVRETDFPRAVEVVARRRGTWAAIAPRVLPLDELVEGALRPMSEGRAPAIKTLIDPAATASRPLRG
jgi:(R,R)-butanediol dehydrogenase / meso-butanediol dehydrogenase / diacetyl reductase